MNVSSPRRQQPRADQVGDVTVWQMRSSVRSATIMHEACGRAQQSYQGRHAAKQKKSGPHSNARTAPQCDFSPFDDLKVALQLKLANSDDLKVPDLKHFPCVLLTEEDVLDGSICQELDGFPAVW